VFLNFLKEYTEHVCSDAGSLICKKLGLYDFYFKDLKKNVKIVVMEALDPLVPEIILRKYDLKGSKSDRGKESDEIVNRVLQDPTQSIDKPVLLDNHFRRVGFSLTFFDVLDRGSNFHRGQRLLQIRGVR